MRKILRSCLVLSILALVGTLICASVWFVGTLVLGLPTARENLGAPAPDLDQMQEIGLSIYLMLNQGRLDEPAGDPRIVWTIEVEPGDSAQSVIDQLTMIGLLDKPILFRSYIRYLGLDRGIETGTYELSGAMSTRELATALQSASIDTLILTIPEGWRIEEIAEAIFSLGLPISISDFSDAAASTPFRTAFSFEFPEGGSLEGFLFPDTYRLEPDMTSNDIIDIMLANFERKVDDSLRQAFENQELSVYEAVSLASIVEREAIVPEERPRIAAVFLNRLDAGMNLDADPTVQYALASFHQDEWWPQLSLSDLAFDSPYNTYRYPGLPPGAIAAPGLASLRAIAFPIESTEYFFRALCDGSGRHVFAETFEEHQANSCP